MPLPPRWPSCAGQLNDNPLDRQQGTRNTAMSKLGCPLAVLSACKPAYHVLQVLLGPAIASLELSNLMHQFVNGKLTEA